MQKGLEYFTDNIITRTRIDTFRKKAEPIRLLNDSFRIVSGIAPKRVPDGQIQAQKAGEPDSTGSMKTKTASNAYFRYFSTLCPGRFFLFFMTGIL